MTNDLSPSLEEWNKLYTAAIELKEIGPWDWMSDSDLIGVENPQNGEIGYCSVLGALGEFLGLAVYLGPEGLEVCEKIRSGKIAPEDPEVGFVQKCLLTSFQDRKSVEKKDMDVMKQLGLKFRGPYSWPLFRSYEPGYYPWFLERQEALYLTLALEQAKDVALRFKTNANLLTPPADGLYFVRVAEQGGGDWVWRDDWLPPGVSSEPEMKRAVLDELRLQRIKKKNPQNHGVWEAEFFHIPMPVKEEGRPYYPYVLLLVDHDQGLILTTRLEKRGSHFQVFVNAILDVMEEGYLPEEILFRRSDVSGLLEPLASKLGFRLKRVRKLREVEKARRSMEKALLRS